MDESDYKWAAAIIEGEGTFRFYSLKNRPKTKSIGITVKMTDLDVLEKLQKILNVGKINGPIVRGTNKPIWDWSVQNQKGTFNTLIRIMPYLGKRRLVRAKELFEWLEPRVVR